MRRSEVAEISRAGITGFRRENVAIAQVDRLLMGVRKTSFDVSNILWRAGIKPSTLDVPSAKVSVEQCAGLIKLLARETRDESFLRCSRPVRIGTFAQACNIMIQGASLEAALRNGLNFYSQACPDLVPRLDVRAGVARIVLLERTSWDYALGYAQCLMLYFGFGVISWLIDRKLPLISVDLRYASERSGPEMTRLFGSTVNFDRAFASFSFKADLLKLPIVQTPATLKDFLAAAPANLIGEFRHNCNIAERTRRLIRSNLPERVLTIEEVAERLALTPQTLRNRYLKEGARYQEIKNKVRLELAIEYLARRELSLEQVSSLVGFSDPGTFNRAFKCWTGYAPGAYRYERFGMFSS